MIKAICFDLDGVYFTEDGKKGFHKALVELTGSEEKVVHVLYKSPEMLEYVTGKMSEEVFWDYVRDYLGLELSNEELTDLWTKEYKINQRVRNTVHKAKEKGYLTCVCSNNNPARVRSLQEKFGFLDDFDVKIFSYKISAVKPSIEIFEALIKQSNVAPEEIIVSDDVPEKLKGAQELGINTFVYKNFEQFLAELKKRGVNLDENS
ncbi:HAD-IA family hydrolase [Candidatus Dojkabacteria bacterium]|nr:HAD-IA family hydrolase [Candidatus Dojkabacteria bacterium]